MNLIFHKKLNKFITKIYITKELVEHLEYILKKLKKDQLLVNGMNNEFTQEKKWTSLKMSCFRQESIPTQKL